MEQQPSDSDELRRIVELHDVMYEARPHEDVVKHGDKANIVKNGFDLNLRGTHDHGHTAVTPGCRKCAATYRDLKRIAQWIMPPKDRPSSHDIRCFDRALHGVQGTTQRFEVELTIEIRHRRGWDEPIDECEKQCLQEMEEKLSDLGVRRR